MRAIFTVILVLALAGCASATMISPPGRATSLGPTNEKSRPGIIKFQIGSPAIARDNRKEAYRQMHAACNGKYKILSEGPKESSQLMLTPNMLINTNEEYLYIKFQCENI